MAIGFFDGIHLGHQQLLRHAKNIAEQQNLLFTAMTFDPHPDEVINNEKARNYLTPLSEKIDKMEKMGVDALFVIHFDRTFASLSPADYIQNYILELNTRHVVVGFDFRFGHKAQGNTQVLAQAAKQSDFGLSVIPKKMYDNKKISSTLIRECIQAGRVEVIPFYLGANYQIKAVISNTHTIGIFQLDPIENFIFPKEGSYNILLMVDARSIPAVLQCDRGKWMLMVRERITNHQQTVTIEFLSQAMVKKTMTM